MNIKRHIVEWLKDELPKPQQPKDVEKELLKAVETLDRKFTQRIAKFQVVHCYVCKKPMIAGKDAIYTNFKGHKFCSHDCIDKQEVSNE